MRRSSHEHIDEVFPGGLLVGVLDGVQAPAPLQLAVGTVGNYFDNALPQSGGRGANHLGMGGLVSPPGHHGAHRQPAKVEAEYYEQSTESAQAA